MRAILLLTTLALAACSTGERANKPDEQADALNRLSPANTPDNEAAAAGNVVDTTTDYQEGNSYTPDPNTNQYDRR